MAQVTVKQTSPMADQNRKACMEAINNLNDTELSNFKKLLESPKAKSYLGNAMKFQMLKAFI